MDESWPTPMELKQAVSILPKPAKLKRCTSKMIPFIPEAEESSNSKYERLHPTTVCPPSEGRFVIHGSPARLIPLDFRSISFSPPKKMTFGYKVDVFFGGEPLSLQTPPMCCTFGLNVYKNKIGSLIHLPATHFRPELPFDHFPLFDSFSGYFTPVSSFPLDEFCLVFRRYVSILGRYVLGLNWH